MNTMYLGHVNYRTKDITRIYGEVMAVTLAKVVCTSMFSLKWTDYFGF